MRSTARRSPDNERLIPAHRPNPLEVLLGALVVLDPGGTVLAWSPAAEALYGWSAEEAVGHPVESLVGMGPLADEAKRRGARRGWALTRPELPPGLRARRRRDGDWITVEVLRIAIGATPGVGACYLDYSRNPAEAPLPAPGPEGLSLFPTALQLAMEAVDAAVRDLTVCPYCNWVEAGPGRWVDPAGGLVDLALRRLTPGLCPTCSRVEGMGR